MLGVKRISNAGVCGHLGFGGYHSFPENCRLHYSIEFHDGKSVYVFKNHHPKMVKHTGIIHLAGNISGSPYLHVTERIRLP